MALNKLSAEELADIHARISATMAPTYSSERGDVGTQGRIHIEDWAALDFHARALQSEADRLRAALDKAHEAAEVSECRIAEVYDRIVKARDHLQPWLEPGSAQGDAMQAAFQCLQEAKYGLGGRTNVASTIAQLKRPAPADAPQSKDGGK